jgi:uncharacterized protein (DUF1501 family)
LFSGGGGWLSRSLTGSAAPAQFTSTSALLHYIIGASGQNAINSRSTALGDRQHLLDTEAEHWQRLDPKEYAFTRTLTEQLRVHDDRAEFLAGIDLILAGMMAPSTPARRAARSTTISRAAAIKSHRNSPRMEEPVDHRLR